MCILICEARSNLERLKYDVKRRMKGIIYDGAGVRMRGMWNCKVTGSRDSPAQLAISWNPPPPTTYEPGPAQGLLLLGVFFLATVACGGSGPGFL